jgi:hypothetical protein
MEPKAERWNNITIWNESGTGISCPCPTFFLGKIRNSILYFFEGTTLFYILILVLKRGILKIASR